MDDKKDEIKMARLGGTVTGLFYRFSGRVLVYSEDRVVLVKEEEKNGVVE